MPLPIAHPGLVISYSYLWHREYALGRYEGLKNRPCAIVVASKDSSVIVVPITHSPPPDPTVAVEIPQATKKRLGLDSDRSWIIIDEVNKFIWPGVDLFPISNISPPTYSYGVLPPKLFRQIKEKIIELANTNKLKQTRREA